MQCLPETKGEKEQKIEFPDKNIHSHESLLRVLRYNDGRWQRIEESDPDFHLNDDRKAILFVLFACLVFLLFSFLSNLVITLIVTPSNAVTLSLSINDRVCLFLLCQLLLVLMSLRRKKNSSHYDDNTHLDRMFKLVPLFVDKSHLLLHIHYFYFHFSQFSQFSLSFVFSLFHSHDVTRDITVLCLLITSKIRRFEEMEKTIIITNTHDTKSEIWYCYTVMWKKK